MICDICPCDITNRYFMCDVEDRLVVRFNLARLWGGSSMPHYSTLLNLSKVQ